MFDEYITAQARSRPNAPAILIAGREISFARFDADINRVAAALQTLPLEGEVVAVAVRKEYFHWLAVLALARLGATSASAPEKTARFTVTDQAREEGAARTLYLSEGILDGPEAHIVPVRRDPATIGRLVHTSGTTGRQKTIAAPWRDILGFLAQVTMPPGPQLLAMGTDTGAGFAMPLAIWAKGNPVILGTGGKATPDLLALRPVVIGMPPDQLRRLLDALPADFVPMPEMRISLAGGVVPPALAREARRRLTPNLVSVYGTSECGAIAIAEGALLEEGTPGAAGYVVPGVEVEIVDVRGRPVPAGTQGQIRVRSPYLPPGYFDDPAQTAKSFREGWFYPGDLCRLLDDGLLVVDGRVDDLMNFGGYKVLPAELEEAVQTCPGVREVAAFAVPDHRGLNRCWLAIVAGGGFDPEALAPAIRRALPRPPPIRWISVSALPRNAMGKVQRDRLRAAAAKRQDEERMPA